MFLLVFQGCKPWTYMLPPHLLVWCVRALLNKMWILDGIGRDRNTIFRYDEHQEQRIRLCMRHNLLVFKVCLLKPIQKLDILKNICFLNHFNSMNGTLLIIYITRDRCPISPTDQRWLRYRAHQYVYHNSVIILERLFEYIFITD